MHGTMSCNNSSKLLFEECTEKLRKERTVPFTRQQLIDCVKEKYPELKNMSLANHLIEISRDITASAQQRVIDLDEIKWTASLIVDLLKNSPYWNERRWAAYAVGSIGQVNIVLVKDAIPVLIDYIQYPDKPISEILAIAKHDKHVAADIYASESLVDPKEMLREACIGVIDGFAQCHPESVKEAIPILENINRKLAERRGKEPENKPAQRLWEKGLEFLNKKNYKMAIEYFDQALALSPDYYKYKLYRDKGNAYFAIGEFEKAIETYNQFLDKKFQERYYKVIGAKEVKTEKCYILYRMGDVYFQLKEYDKTIRFYEKALNTDYVSKSRLINAILAFDKCLKIGIDEEEKIKMRHPTLYEEIMNKYKSWEKVAAIAKKSSST